MFDCCCIKQSLVLGVHTNLIEAAWRAAKAFVKRRSVRGAIQLQEWLNVYMWRQWYALRWPGGVFCRFLTDVRQLYPV